MTTERFAWVCSTAFDCEIGETEVTLFADPEDIPCCADEPGDCWPVKVRVVLEPPDEKAIPAGPPE